MNKGVAVLGVERHTSLVDHVNVLAEIPRPVHGVILFKCDLVCDLDYSPDELVVCRVSQHFNCLDKASELSIEHFFTEGDR